MTESTHVYRAFLIGTPDVELAVRGGRISLDSGRSPHVTAQLEVSTGSWVSELVEYPDDEGFGFGEGPFGENGFGGYFFASEWSSGIETRNALDPRLGARVRIEVEATFPTGVQTRSFDLGVRERPIEHTDATIMLRLASDEQMLEDWGPLADDHTPMEIAGSLRDVVEYVLDTVIPGTSLESSPSNDADVSAYWDATNMLLDPSCEGATFTDAFRLGTGATDPVHVTALTVAGTHSWRWETTSTGHSAVLLSPDDKTYRVQPGQFYTARAFVRSQVSRDARIFLRFFNEAGVKIKDFESAYAATPTSGWAPYSITGKAPANASYVVPMIVTSDNTIGTVHYFDAAMLYEGEFYYDYFDGDTADGAGYVYEWTDSANASPSTRSAYPVERAPEALTWSAGQSAMDFLQPLVESAGYRLVCNENREWTLRDENHLTPGMTTIRHAANMTDAAENISRESGVWFDAAVTRYEWTDASGREHVRVDSYALDTPYTRLKLFEKSTPYPGKGFSEYAVRRAQQRGREVSASTVSDWRANSEQSLTIVLENTITQTGTIESLEFNLDTDVMTVKSRTTDTPDAAWLLIPAGESWLEQPDGESWEDEVI